MNENDRQDDAALDRLLARARWPEPTAADEYRLREEWIYLRRRRRIGPVLYLTAAAAIVFVVGMSLIQIAKPTEPVVAPKMLAIAPPEIETPLIESRPANSYEMLLVMQKAPVARGQAVLAAAPEPASPPLDPKIRKLVDQLGDPLVKNRYDAARELANMNPPGVVPILEEMIEQGVNRREALAALMLSNDPLARQALEGVRASRTIEAQMLALRTEIR